jgi:acetyl-CoA carboxylase biotin carboxyl carrier protein
MDLRKVKTLIDLVSESQITELEITEGEDKVRIVKAIGALPSAPVSGIVPVPLSPPVVAAATPVVTVPVAPAPASADEGHVVKSPMVGTFYRSPSPDKPPFVDVGSKVATSDTVCLIEAMKLLNEIEAGFEGQIRKILVENGQAVEYGQPLFIIG